MPSTNVSILNEVLGPVMRGPSSSHTAAAVRIGMMCRGVVNGEVTRVEVVYDPEGSLASVAEDQGNNMGLCGGLQGWDCSDPRLETAQDHLKNTAKIAFKITEEHIEESTHPNTHKIYVNDHQIIALSTGGGAVTLQSIDGVRLDTRGTRYMGLIYTKDPTQILEALTPKVTANNWVNIQVLPGTTRAEGFLPGRRIVMVDSCCSISAEALEGAPGAEHLCVVPLVMPVATPPAIDLPFKTVGEMQKHAEGKQLWELALEYEKARSGLIEDEILEKIDRLVGIYETSIDEGLKGTSHSDRILGPQSTKYRSTMDLGVLDDINKYTSAFMEVKSSFGLIIAAPTAGSCGIVPGCLIATARRLSSPRLEISKALLCCGLIGVFIATRSTFAAEEGGCQAECGAAGSMAAAGLVYLHGGGVRESITAASMTLQSVLGMACDPIANRVEAPCLLRNINTASMAASSTNLALSGFSSVIPYDEVLAAHWEISTNMPRGIRCTGLAGLAAQPSSGAIQKSLGCGSCSCSKGRIEGTIYPEIW
eukprot:TRINITY_DN21754_c0_g1_i1.p1 TRINITY_DN21754_c0_g1~~TRINITY_DN21754_c0_g1_i1.p1  ORF type:complete len:547 (+),score=98.22 TRINITY_DN21754_c0_g1_i1:36-1643(+)